MTLQGLSAFPITPCSPDGAIDAPALRRLLGRLTEAGVDSIGLLGSTGSYPYLTRQERRRAIEIALAEVAGRIPLVVGVGALRTDEAVALAQDAKALGVPVGLLAAVSYTPLTDDEVFEHFATVARESGLPLCIYDNPSTTHFSFTPALVSRLSRVPGIVAVKSPGLPADKVPAHLEALRQGVPSTFSLGYSGDWFATEALIAGARAWYSVAAGLFPKVCLSIARAAESGQADEARRINATLEPLWELFREFSGLRVMYAAVAALDLCHNAPPRPLLPIPEEGRRRVADVIACLDLA